MTINCVQIQWSRALVLSATVALAACSSSSSTTNNTGGTLGGSGGTTSPSSGGDTLIPRQGAGSGRNQRWRLAFGATKPLPAG